MSIIKKILEGVLFTAVFTGAWILLDYLISEFITKSGFAFSASDIIYPALLGTALYLVLFVFIKKKKK